MPSIIRTTSPKKKKGANTKAKREAKAAFEAMKKRHKEAPKLGSKYGVAASAKKLKREVDETVDRKRQMIAERIAEARSVPSLVSTDDATGTPLPEQYEGKMAKREAKARQRKHIVAPIANKMGYGLITDAEHLKTMGKKT